MAAPKQAEREPSSPMPGLTQREFEARVETEKAKPERFRNPVIARLAGLSFKSPSKPVAAKPKRVVEPNYPSRHKKTKES